MIKPLEWVPRCRAAGRDSAGGEGVGGGSGGQPRGGRAALVHRGKAKYCLIQLPEKQTGLPLSVGKQVTVKAQAAPTCGQDEGQGRLEHPGTGWVGRG